MMYLDKITVPKILIPILLTFLFLCASTSSHAQADYHVNASTGNDTNDGLSWSTAFATLQKAIDEAVANDEIWVAEGTYYPSKESDGTTDSQREFTFFIDFDVKIYGGFPNTGTPTMGDRDWENHKTILSGDLDMDDTDGLTGTALLTNGTRNDNSYTVVRTENLSSTCLINGFFVEGGNANLGSGIVTPPNHLGGGMLNSYSNPTLTNCSFSNNSADFDGGGMYNRFSSNSTLTNCSFSNNSAGDGGGMYNDDDSNPTLTNCSFSNNSASDDGGGMYNFYYSNPTLTNCSFSNNSADRDGGGMYNLIDSNPTLTNCSFSKNSADDGGGMYNFESSNPILTNCSFSKNSADDGGGMYNFESSNPILTNCILWGNGSEIFNIGSSPTVTYSIVEDGYTGTGNLDQDPLFIDPANNDLRISLCSPAINAGSNDADLDGSGGETQTIADIATDLAGNARIAGATVDMGAYEERQPDITGNLEYCVADNTTTLDAGTWTSYKWSNGETSQSIAATEGTYTITVTNSNDCTGTDEVTVTENESPSPSINGNLEYCASDKSTTLDAGNGTNYKWSNGETSQEIEVSEGTYTVTVSNSNGCTGTDEVTVTENADPKPAFNNHTLNENWVVCSEEMEAKYKLKREELGSDGNYNNSFDNYADYTWTIINGDFDNNPNKNEGKRTAKVDWTTGPVTGEVMVTVTDANGCQGNTMLSIEVLAPLQPVITGTFEYCRGREATLDVGTYALAPQTYQWSNGETVQSFSTTSIGVYTVTVTNQEGCTGTATAEVSATPCLAEAGVLTTNAVTICAGGNIEVSTTSQQTGANYLQYFFIYTQDNLNNTSLHEYAIADYGNGEASASFGDLAAGDYLVCAYNECQDCLPNPSPITTSLDDIDQIGTIQDGCFDFQCANITVPEAFAPDMNGTGLITENNAAGQNIYIAEVCGGTAPYTIDFESSAGLFAAVNDYPSPIAGCIKYQILYVPEADWTLTVTDDNDCQNETVVFTNEGTSSTTPVLQIVGHTAEVETCVGDADGSISVEVEGGDSTCGEYSYSWSGPNGFSISAIGSTTGNTATGLASGKYDVTVTDCTGTTTVREGMNVARKTRGRSRSRGGCKTTGNNFLQGFEANENIMLGVYPNPFADKTSIEFTLSETSKIWLSVYAMDGREVKELLKGETRESAVLNRVNLEAEGLQNGLYILQLETESGERLHTKLLISK